MNGFQKRCAVFVAWLKRVLRTGLALSKTPDLPKWLRVVFVVGCLPIIGPLDEVVLLVAVLLAVLFYRPVLRATWMEVT